MEVWYSLSVPVSVLVLGAALAPMEGVEQVTASEPAAALALLSARPFDAVLTRHAGPPFGLDFLRACLRTRPDARRLLLASYQDLPGLALARARGLVSRVVPLEAGPEKLARTLRSALSDHDDLSVSRSVAQGAAWEAAEELVRYSAARLAQVPGVIVRPLAPDPHALQLQFVLRGSKRIEALRDDLVRRWLLPLKARGAKAGREQRSHPVAARLGGLSSEAEVWAREVPGAGAFVYVALLPWKSEPRHTAVLGLCTDRYEPGQWQLLADAHRQALAELSEFALPEAPSERDQERGAAMPEYDWIVTPGYVGLDRRRTPTSLFNRFLFHGRRRHVPARLGAITDSFTDRPRRRVWSWFAAYAVLSTLDTALTFVCVRRGLVREANPLLRPLVLHHPAAFLVVKNALALLAFLLVARFERFRLGPWLLGAAVLGFAALDLYWAALLTSR